MTTEEMIGRALRHLDDDRVRYPADETIHNGLNPAQDLITLMKPYLRHTHEVTIPALSGFVDLYDLDPTIVNVDRVLRGKQRFDRTQDDTYAQDGQLEPAHLETLRATRPHWYTEVGIPRRYFLHGRTLMYIWPRPEADTIVTIDALCVPTPLSTDNVARASELEDDDHELAADVSYCLLLIKEGAVEVDKAFTRLGLILQHDAFADALRHIRRRSREWAARVQVPTDARS